MSAGSSSTIPKEVEGLTDECSTPALGGDFSLRMKPNELAQWLLQEYGDDFKEGIDKLKQSKINGRLFLKLPEDEKLLNPLELSYQFKVLILGKVEELTESTNLSATPASNNKANLPIPQSSEHGILECGTAELDVDDTSAVTANSASPSGVRSAWVPKSVMWPQGMPILRVKFLNTIPSNWTYKGSGLNLGNIEQWANIWHDRGGGQIPEFQFVVAEDAPSDVRVMFVGGKESSRSIVGKKAQDQHQDNPTMWLNLSSGGDNYKKHVVIHEFGHALGLGHEHQRSDFWKIVKPYVNVGAIISEVGKASFDVNWGKDHEYNKKNATKYDPLSVMHYSFRKEWLVDVEKTLKEGNKVAAVLHGILERTKNPYVTEPSKEDIDLLKQLYSHESLKGDVCTTQAASSPRVTTDSQPDSTPTTDANILSPGNHERLFSQLTHHAAKWREIGTYLGFTQSELDKIQEKPGLFMGAPDSWLREMLTQWLQWKPGNQRGSTEYPTLDGLRLAMDKAGLARAAGELSL